MSSKTWKDPVWSKVISYGIIGVIGIISGYIMGWLPFIKSLLLDGFSTIWKYISSSTLTPNWLLIVLGVITTLFIVLIAILVISSFKRSSVNYTEYTSDNFYKFKWAWSYIGGTVNNIYSLCPKCNYEISPSTCGFNLSYGYCEECGYETGRQHVARSEIERKVLLKIHKNIRNGDWEI